ncbi:hypothetical protein [Pseudoduganella sp. GCM10020061]|uniref:hypothetical protein n=1 Tax=Pseudoduganella sp. GCM10020061 TaxID=3317345 RepID=UPI00362A81AD
MANEPVRRPTSRARSDYRLWRDLGYAGGAVVAGFTADLLGLHAAVWLVAALTFGSGVIAALRMTETLKLDTGLDDGKNIDEYSP